MRQKGQGLVEYAIVLVLVGLAIIFLARLFAGNNSNESITPINPTQSVLSTPSISETQVSIEYGEVFYTERTINRIIDSQIIDIPNCNGSSEAERSRTLTKSISRETRIVGGTDVTLYGPGLLTHINAELGINTSETISDTQEITLRAAPNTSVSYTINFVEESKVGTIEIIRGNQTQYIEFAVSNAINIQQEEPVRQSCDGSGSDN